MNIQNNFSTYANTLMKVAGMGLGVALLTSCYNGEPNLDNKNSITVQIQGESYKVTCHSDEKIIIDYWTNNPQELAWCQPPTGMKYRPTPVWQEPVTFIPATPL